jgi:hypothetical protein
MMEEKTASRTGSVHPGISHSSTKKASTAYALAGGVGQPAVQDLVMSSPHHLTRKPSAFPLDKIRRLSDVRSVYENGTARG